MVLVDLLHVTMRLNRKGVSVRRPPCLDTLSRHVHEQAHSCKCPDSKTSMKRQSEKISNVRLLSHADFDRF